MKLIHGKQKHFFLLLVLSVFIFSGEVFAATDLTISPTSKTLEYAATSDSFYVICAAAWSTSKDPADDWISSITPAGQTGNGWVVINFSTNYLSQNQRVGLINVDTDDGTNSKIYSLRQNGDTEDPTVSVTSKMTNDQTPSLTGTFDDNTATVSVTVNGIAYNDINNGPGTIVVSGASSPYTWTLSDNIVNTLADGTYSITATAEDPAGNIGTDITSDELVIDTTPPTLLSVHIESDKIEDATLAKPGDVITLTFTVDETLGDVPTVLIDGKAAAVNNSGYNYTATYTMLSSDVDGDPLPFSIDFVDEAGNSGVTVSSTTDATEVKFDKTAPTMTEASIISNNSNTALALSGNIITLTFKADETLGATPVVTISGQSGSVTSNGNNSYTATYTMKNTDSDAASIAFTIDFEDEVGNSGTTVSATTDGSGVKYDNTAPTLSNVSILSDNADNTLAKVGDEVSLQFTVNEALKSAPTVYIFGTAANITNSGLTYTATYVLQNSDTDGTVSFTIDFTDEAGNNGAQGTGTTDATAVTFDKTNPILSNVTIYSNNTDVSLAKVGDVVYVGFTVSEVLIGDPTVDIAGQNASVSQSGLNYTASYTMQNTDADAAAVSFTIDFVDKTGNSGTTGTNTNIIDDTSVKFDKTPPVLSVIHIESNNSDPEKAKAGDVVTLTFTVNETLIQAPTIILAGNAVVPSQSGYDYTATYTMLNTDNEAAPITFSINYTDASGNAGTEETTTDDASSVTFDRTKPTLANVSITSSNGDVSRAKVGDLITISFTASEALLSGSTVTIHGNSATLSNTGLDYSAIYAMQESDNTVDPIPFTIDFFDEAGNTGTTVSSTDDATAISFDKTLPTLSSVHIESDNADASIALVGNQITLTFTVSELLLADPTVLIGGKAAAISNLGFAYTATYTLLNGDSEANPLTFSIDFSDLTSNAGVTVSSTDDGTSVKFDKTSPTLSAVNIQSNNTNSDKAKVGDIITLTFTVSEALNADPTVTIAGQSATVTQSGLNYTALYTMKNTDADDSDLNFTIDFTDEAGNAGTQVSSTATYGDSKVAFDKTVPTLANVHIESNNTNSSSLAKVGDQINLTFTASETFLTTPTILIGGKSPTISLSGLNYSAKYVMTSSDAEADPLSFTIDFTDEAGNVGTQVTGTDDASSVSFDKTAPQLSVVSISSNNDNTSYAKIGDVITINITANEALLASPTVSISANSAAVVSNGSNSYTATYTMTVNDPDAAPLVYTIDFTDIYGNVGTQVAISTDLTAVIYDKTAPSLSSVHIESNNTTNTDYATVGDSVILTFTVSEILKANPIVTIGGNAVTVSSSVLDYSAAWVMLVSDTEADPIAFTINFTDAAGNAGLEVTTTDDVSEVEFDQTDPVVASIHIESSNTDSTRAKVGDFITLTFSSSEVLSSDPSISILGNVPISLTNSGLNYTAKYTLQSSDSDLSNPVSFTIDYVDNAGNSGLQKIASDDGSDVIFDKTIPTLSNVHLKSDNANVELSKSGDTISLTFSSDESLLSTPVITIAQRTAGVTNAGLDYTATYTMQDVDAETDSIRFLISLVDLTGNTNQISVTSDASNVSFDKTPPTVYLSYSDSLVLEGDNLVILLNPNEDLLSFPAPAINIIYAGGSTQNNVIMTYQAYKDTTLWNYTSVVPAGNDGYLNIELDVFDLAGNPADTISTGYDVVLVDNIAPANFDIIYTVPYPDSVNFRSYYGKQSQSIFAKVPIDASDASLLDGSLQVKMKGVGTNTEYDIGSAITILNTNDKVIEFSDADMTTYLFSKPGIVDGMEIMTRVELKDKVGNSTFSPIALDTFIVDRIQPVAGIITDGVTSDIDFIKEGETLQSFWSGFNDNETDIKYYEYSIGSAPNLRDYVGWQNVALVSSITDNNYTIAHNEKYFFNLRATDMAGNISDTVSTDGILADFVLPESIPVMGPYYFDTEWAVDDSIRGTIYDDGSWIESFSMTLQRASDNYYFHGAGWLADSTNLILGPSNIKRNPVLGQPSDWSYQIDGSYFDSRENYLIKTACVDSAGNIQTSANTDQFQYIINIIPEFSQTSYVNSLFEDELFTANLKALDADIGTLSDDSLEFTFEYAPQGMTLSKTSDTTATINWLTDNWDTGDTSVSIIVTDGRSASDTTILPITVVAVNDAPEAFVLKSPADEYAFIKTSADSFRFVWEKPVDVDDTTLVYRMRILSGVTDTLFTLNDTALSVDMTGVNFSDTSDTKWIVSASDAEFTTVASDTFTFSTLAPDFALSIDAQNDSIISKIVYPELQTIDVTLRNEGFENLSWNVYYTPGWIVLSGSLGVIKKNTAYTLSLEMTTENLRLGTKYDSLLLASNDPDRDTIKVRLKLDVVSIGHISIAVVQNMAFGNYYEIMLNDSLGMIDSLKFFIDDVETAVDKVDNYTFIGNTKFLTAGSHILKVTSSSFAGANELLRNLSVVLGKGGESWSGSSSDGLLTILGKRNSLINDQYMLIVDSTAFSNFESPEALYRIGSPGYTFESPVIINLPDNGDESAIYIKTISDCWEELPTFEKDGKLQAWTSDMGYFKFGERTIIVAEETQLGSNYPNPFNPVTSIRFDLGFSAGPQRVICKIYNMLGQEVITLNNSYLDVGHYEWKWFGQNKYGIQAASGVYITRIITESGYIKTQKMVLIR